MFVGPYGIRTFWQDPEREEKSGPSVDLHVRDVVDNLCDKEKKMIPWFLMDPMATGVF